MKITAAMPLTSSARTFLVALERCSVSGTPMPSTAISSTPWAAPKYPPYTPVSSTVGHTHQAPWSGSPPPASCRAATAFEMRGWKTTSTQPSRISTGTIAENASSGSTSSSTAPTTPPISDAGASRSSRARCPTSSRR